MRLTLTIPVVVGIILIALKLDGALAWSWLWVLAPLWFPPLVAFGLSLVLIVCVGLALLFRAFFPPRPRGNPHAGVVRR